MNNKIKTYMHISAGRGPAECCWVVAKTYQELVKHCQKNAISIKLIEQQIGPKPNTFYSILVEVIGTYSPSKIKEWEGTIQWIGKSQYRKNHKRKNWFIGISVFKLEIYKKISLKHIEFKTYRASGPGGQHRNKVETAVRVTHIKTGISTTASDSRSQQQNKQNAIKKLKSIFDEQRIEYQKQLMENKWKDHLLIERGNSVKLFTGSNFKKK